MTTATTTGFDRRTMVGWLIAGPTLLTAATWGADPAKGQIPTVNVADVEDLSDLLRQSTVPTSGLIAVQVNPDGTVSFDLPRSENGQGITTSSAMIIADEMGIPVENVKITLADARPELLFNQFTGGSVSMFELFLPLRTAAALARNQMMSAAARQFKTDESALTVADGVISGAGQSLGFGELAKFAAVRTTKRMKTKVQLKQNRDLKVVGTDVKRLDARAAVTGEKIFAMDLKVPDALPCVICKAPTINGNAEELLNEAEIRSMPGITDVAVLKNTSDEDNGVINGGIAIRGETFGQCFDAVRACKVRWSPGSAAGKTIESVTKDLQQAELPMTPALPGNVVEETFTFHFRPGDPLETNCAVADVRADRAEIWSALKSPIWAKGRIAAMLNLPQEVVKVHVTEGGGSFGRHLFCDGAFEAAAASKAFGKPVRLMWTRADGPRQGRCQPMQLAKVRMVHAGGNVLSLDQRVTGVMTDFTQGLGDALTAVAATPPGQNFLQYSQTVFNLTASVPYNFGVTTQLLNEVYDYNTFNTSSVRNIYSPQVRTSIEVLMDKVAAEMGMDPFDFREKFSRAEDRQTALLKVLREKSEWGKAMPAGTAQGVGLHREYKGYCGCVVEIDCRPKTVNRVIKGAKTGPRVMRVTQVVDVGLPINPLGLKAQMIGGIMDGIGQALTYGLHLQDGAFLEASWDNAFYTRQWNVPPEVDVHVMPFNGEQPGGAGELGVAAPMAATACAYARATGTMPTEFPITFNDVGFKPYPLEPPIPKSPKNGLKFRNAPKQR